MGANVVSLGRGDWRHQEFTDREMLLVMGVYREMRSHMPIEAEMIYTDRGDPVFTMSFVADGEPHIAISKVGNTLVALVGPHQNTVLYKGLSIEALCNALWVPVEIAEQRGLQQVVGGTADGRL